MSTNSLIGGLVGGVAGFFLAGPLGVGAAAAAFGGAGIGMGLGAALTPIPGMSQQGPRLSDLKVQTSTYGAAIPRVYGTVGITGNVFWLEGNKLKEVVTRRKVKSGGKGGSKKATVTTYTYYATLAIGLCEGPIAGVRRIWAGPNLIYDAASDDLDTIIASNRNAAGFTIYHGSADQQPDSRIQADRGVANTPAYRGLAYVVIKDFLLTDYGNAIPAFKVEVVSALATAAPVLQMSREFPIAIGDSGVTLPADFARGYGHIVQPNVAAATFNAYRVTAGGLIEEPTGVVKQSAVPPFKWTIAQWSMGIGSHAFSTRSGDYLLIDGTEYLTDYSGGDNLFVYRLGDLLAFVPRTAPAIHLEAGRDVSGNIIWNTKSFAGYVAFNRYGDGFIGYNPSAGTVAIIDASLAVVQTITLTNPHSYSLGVAIDVWQDRIYAARGNLVRVYDLSGAFVQELSLPFYQPISAQFPMIVRDGIIACYAESPARLAYCSIGALQQSDAPLAAVIASEIGASGVNAGDVDTSELSGSVRGYRISGGSIRSALDPLRATWPFDAYQSGYQIRVRPRGQVSAATIAIAELGVDEQLPQTREMDGQLPAKLSVGYLDAARNYDANEQFAERINTDAVNEDEIELAVVMTASEAAQAVDRLLQVAWLERVGFGPFQLPPTYRHLEPADVITIDAGYAQYEIRLTEVSYNADGSLTCSGMPNNSAVYVSAAASDETPSTGTIALPGASLFVPLDIPVIDESVQDSPGFVAAMTGYSSGWPGAVLVRSGDGGQTFAELQGFDGKATLGYALGTLAASPCTLIDETVLSVSLVSGDLESITEAQMLAGQHWAAYGVDGRWEIVRFRDAVLQADGSYRLSGFKRGDKGTEWATGLHQRGDLFVLLDDDDLAAVGLSVESIGQAGLWRGVTSGDSLHDADDVAFTYRGVNLECLSPVYPVASRNGSGDLALAWTRRSRLSSSWWATGTAAPLGEASEAYEVDILNGSTVVRTIGSSTPSITYTAAQQTADFGSAQASIVIRIYQLSAVVGRGLPLEGTY